MFHVTFIKNNQLQTSVHKLYVVNIFALNVSKSIQEFMEHIV